MGKLKINHVELGNYKRILQSAIKDIEYLEYVLTIEEVGMRRIEIVKKLSEVQNDIMKDTMFMIEVPLPGGGSHYMDSRK